MMRVVHIERTHPHQAEKFAGLFVTIARPIFRQAQRQIPIAARFRRENPVMMRAIHRLEVILGRSTLISVRFDASPLMLQPFP